MKLSIGDRIKTLGITTFCHYAECRVLFIIKLNVIMLNVSMLSVVMLSVVAPLSHPRRVGEGQKGERDKYQFRNKLKQKVIQQGPFV